MRGPDLINWRGTRIGELCDAIPDMWYIEGRWVSNGSDEAKLFEDLVSKFDARQVMDDPQRGTRVTLSEIQEDAPHGHALVLSLRDGRLCVRRVFEDEAVSWLLENVR